MRCPVLIRVKPLDVAGAQSGWPATEACITMTPARDTANASRTTAVVRSLLAGSALAFLLQACSSYGPPTEPAPTGRIEYDGFSFAAPPGPGWTITRGADGVVMSRMLESPEHTQVAVVLRSTGFDPALVGYPAYATDREVFTRYVKANKENSQAQGDQSRFVMLSDDAITDSRFGYCARTSEKVEDHTPATRKHMLLMETWGYTCLMPGAPKFIVEVAFSERAAPGVQDANLVETREAFFRGFRFSGAATEGPASASGIAAAGAGASAPAATPAASTATPAASAATPGLLVLTVRQSQRESVRKGFEKAAPGIAMVLEGDPRTAEPHRNLRLSFSAQVDRSGQMSNRDGAAIGGLAAVLLGSITPWSCPVIHSLQASLLGPDGTELRTWTITHKDKHVGTMLACPDVEQPEAGAIFELEKELIRRMRAENLLAH